MKTYLKINGEKFIHFSSIEIGRSFDAIASTFSVELYFDPADKKYLQIFQPLKYQKIEIFEDDKLILTGNFINHSFVSNSVKNLVNISGYSTAGILEDVSIPLSLYPLESTKKTLKEISKKILDHFGVSFKIDPSVEKEMNVVFKKSVAGVDESVKDYLSKLANQKNIIITNSNDGNIVFKRVSSDQKIKYQFNKNNCLEMSCGANGQQMFHELTIQRQPTLQKTKNKDRKPVLSTSIKNIMVKDLKRSSVKVLTAGEEGETDQAVKNFLADQLKNISFSLKFDQKLKDLNVGDMVEVINPEIFLFKPTKLIVSDIIEQTTPTEITTNLQLNLPESFNGDSLKHNIFEQWK